MNWQARAQRAASAVREMPQSVQRSRGAAAVNGGVDRLTALGGKVIGRAPRPGPTVSRRARQRVTRIHRYLERTQTRALIED